MEIIVSMASLQGQTEQLSPSQQTKGEQMEEQTATV
jgi:hypothetical protein